MKLKLKNVCNVDIELTNKCNAACPGCNREFYKPDMLNNTEWSLKEIKDILPKEILHSDVEYFFGGTVDDAMMNTQVYEICEYILSFGCYIVLETNGGANTANMFSKLGKLSKQNDNRLTVRFSVDGVEKNNHLYRVNVKWKTVMRNMQSYVTAGGKGLWQYLVFEHNYKDIEEAFEISKNVGIPFELRQGTRDIKPFLSLIKTKNKETREIEVKQVEVKYSKKFTHDHLEERKDLLNEKENIMPTDISCSMLHREGLFLSHDYKLWPCCWWASDSHIPHEKSYFDNLDKQYGKDWNSLKENTIKEIIEHKFYSEVLYNTFIDKDSKNFNYRCQVECGDGAYRHKTKRVSLDDK